MKRLLLFSLAFISLIPLRAQYISEVLEYVPAPGQLVNSSPWGNPASVNTIVGGLEGTLSLGAYGGYVVFRFEGPVENHPDNPYGVDFTIFGNASQSWSEPGAVWVMKDENYNGLPDDTWYELAGSDHYFSTSAGYYAVTYTNPGGNVAADVPWTDNLGGNGVVPAVGGHEQPYYPMADSFPGVPRDSYTLQGALIAAVVDSTMPAFIKSYARAFGYADNRPRGSAPYTIPDNPYTTALENSGGDAFDLDWAVNEAGEYVDLDEVQFIKVQTAIMADGGWLGELSVEIAGAVDVPPDNTVSGIEKVIVVRDLPLTLTTSTLQLEPLVFFEGRLQEDEPVTWMTNMPEATIDENHLLTVTASGELEITATLTDHPEVTATVHTTVDLSYSIPEASIMDLQGAVSPNPAKDFISVAGVDHARVSIMDASGRGVIVIEGYKNQERILVSSLVPGFYLVRVNMGDAVGCFKFIKQ